MPPRKPLTTKPFSPVTEAFESAKAETSHSTVPALATKRRGIMRRIGAGQRRSAIRKRAMQVMKTYGQDIDKAIQNAKDPAIRKFLMARKAIRQREAREQKVAPGYERRGYYY